MAVTIIMPQGGQDITEGVVVRWLKAEGDAIRRGEVLCEVETEKAVFEVEAPADGVLAKIVAAAGARVPIFSVIGVIAAPGEAVDLDRVLAAPAADPPPAITALRCRIPPPAPAEAEGRVRASGRARRLASESGVDLARIAGSGPRGRITEKDVRAHIAARGPSGAVRPLSPMRRAVARRMTESKQRVPHFYVTVSADLTAALSLRDRVGRAAGADIPITALFLKAAGLALRDCPEMNCRLEEDGLLALSEVHVGMAVGLPDGVLVPVLPQADRTPLADIARWVAAAAAAAREGRQAAGAASAALTVSNLGMAGIDSFTAIINPPEAGILAVGSLQRRPVVDEDGAIRARQMVTMTLSADHRVADGALAARFAARIKHHLEHPEELAG